MVGVLFISSLGRANRHSVKSACLNLLRTASVRRPLQRIQKCSNSICQTPFKTNSAATLSLYHQNGTTNMNVKNAILSLLLWASVIASAYSQTGGSGLISISALGHMSVTLLNPAAITASQNLEFNDIQLRSAQSASGSVDCNMSMGSVRISGTQATYAVTVSNNQMGFNQNGNVLSIGNFSAYSSEEPCGSSSVYIGATMSILKRKAAVITENCTPLILTINYN